MKVFASSTPCDILYWVHLPFFVEYITKSKSLPHKISEIPKCKHPILLDISAAIHTHLMKKTEETR
jgi:hypothetical protein